MSFNSRKGVGVCAIATLIVETADSYFGIAGLGATYHLLQRCRIAVYLLILVFWTGALWRREPQRSEMTVEMRARLFSLQGRLGYTLNRLRSGGEDL
jgi:hypothetical protein